MQAPRGFIFPSLYHIAQGCSKSCLQLYWATQWTPVVNNSNNWLLKERCCWSLKLTTECKSLLNEWHENSHNICMSRKHCVLHWSHRGWFIIFAFWWYFCSHPSVSGALPNMDVLQPSTNCCILWFMTRQLPQVTNSLQLLAWMLWWQLQPAESRAWSQLTIAVSLQLLTSDRVVKLLCVPY